MSSSESATVMSVNVFDDSNVDTRRYATFLPSQIAEGMSFMYLDEEDADDDSSLYTDFVSSWEFTSGPMACGADPKHSDSVLSEAQELVKKYQEPDRVTEAQKVVQEYLQRHGRIEDQETGYVCPLNTAKELPITPNNRDSTYTHPVTDDGQSTIDLEKRPEPEIRLFHHDPEGVAQAQLQGLEMVRAGHCTPRGMIRCQRPGCTNVLRDLEALKFHLHIHNIGDMSDVISVLSAHTQKEKEPGHSSTESSPLNKPSRKVRDRSKSLMDMGATSGHLCDTHPTRKVYAKDPYSPPRSRKPSATHIKSSALHTQTKLLDASAPQTRGRRSNRSTIRSGLDEAGYHDSIAMVLSRPASPVQGAQEASGSDMNLPVNFVTKSSVFSPPASPTLGGKELTRATSPKRAFSPARALSPIRGMSSPCILSVRPANVLMSRRSSSTSAFFRMLERV
ncbi:uncharacterized protein BJ212DRAFT_1297253 [Suillus subaureus]|uniref:Uncharacterized protein n=1 Tax=Suillus subaureus TaxID=48587 RepID=A0A9P7JH05_9AGAM|nr:uncharacterized protein BJ212DRAFT_1297253 [Suillus subaureus]KAG1821993.1 hypothetical protein BJ212DRAFT_1297253 [Suillus subaureus]